MCKNCLHVWHVYDYLFVDFVRYHLHALDTYVTFSFEIRLNDNLLENFLVKIPNLKLQAYVMQLKSAIKTDEKHFWVELPTKRTFI